MRTFSLFLSFSAHKREVPYSGEEEEKRRVKVTTRDTPAPTYVSATIQFISGKILEMRKNMNTRQNTQHFCQGLFWGGGRYDPLPGGGPNEIGYK